MFNFIEFRADIDFNLWSAFDGLEIEGVILGADEVISFFGGTNEEEATAFTAVDAIGKGGTWVVGLRSNRWLLSGLTILRCWRLLLDGCLGLTTIRTLRDLDGVLSNWWLSWSDTAAFNNVGFVVAVFSQGTVEGSRGARKRHGGRLEANVILGVATTDVDAILSVAAIEFWTRWGLTSGRGRSLTVRSLGHGRLLSRWGSWFASTASDDHVLVSTFIGVFIVPKSSGAVQFG